MIGRELVTVTLAGLLSASCAHRTGSASAVRSAPVSDPAIANDAKTRVVFSPLGLEYHEGDNVLELTVEVMAVGPVDFVVYVWSPDAWVRETPEWCRHRRGELLADIKRQTAHIKIDWVEEQ